MLITAEVAVLVVVVMIIVNAMGRQCSRHFVYCSSHSLQQP